MPPKIKLPDDVPDNPKPRIYRVLSINDLIDLLEPFGGPTTRASVSLWLKGGKFPNARKRTRGKNSPWLVPLSDVITFIAYTYPNGPMATVEPKAYIRPTYQHVCLTAFGFDPFITTTIPAKRTNMLTIPILSQQPQAQTD